MKPNSIQEISLQKYLRNNLKYRETSAEFYDHIMVALENRPDECDFVKEVQAIINSDFGGMNQMIITEQNYEKAILKEMQNKYLQAVLAFVSTPLFFVLFIYGVIVYYLIKQPWFSIIYFIGLMFIVRLIPGVMRVIRYIRLGYVFADTKRSVRDTFYKWLDYIPGIIVCLMFCTTDVFHSTPPALLKSPTFNLIFLVICGWHALAYYKVYQYDLKTNVMVNYS